MIALKFYLIGVGLTVLFLAHIVFGTLWRLVTYLWWSEETQAVRVRAVLVSMLPVLLLPAAVSALPVPGSVVVSGVVATDDDRVVYAQADGFLSAPRVAGGSRVAARGVLCQLENVVTQWQVAEARAESDVARLQYARNWTADPHASAAAQLRLAQAEEKQKTYEHAQALLTISAPLEGVVTQIMDERDTGRFVRTGDAVATVAGGNWIVRCLATAEQMTQAQPKAGDTVRVRIVADGVCELPGTVENVAVQGSRQVFSPSLSHLGGGDIAVLPGTLESRNSLFEVQVRVHDAKTTNLLHGNRAAVAFRKQPQTYGNYLYHRCHQFLNRLRVS
jgi:hypothetical protein